MNSHLPVGDAGRSEPGVALSVVIACFNGQETLPTQLDALAAQDDPVSFEVILADNGSPWFLSGAPDPRWDNDTLRELRTLRGSDFEAVDTSSLPIDPDSARIPWHAAALGS